jgi:hypothetical protein
MEPAMKDLQTVLTVLTDSKHTEPTWNQLDEAITIVKQMMQAEPVAYAKSISDELMDCVDRLGSEYDQVDPRVWKHLLVYAPQAVPAEPSCPDCHAPHLLYECVHCSASNYPAAPVVKEYEMEPHDQNWIHGEDV